MMSVISRSMGTGIPAGRVWVR